MTTTTRSRTATRAASQEIRRRFVRHGLLGTVIEVAVGGAAARVERVADDVFDEIARLQKVFNRFDEQSELQRYLRGEVEPGAELAEVLALADEWRVRSAGAFDVGTAALSALWTAAAGEGRLPSDREITAVLDVADGRRRYDLGGIAKGWIIDRAVRAVFAGGEVAGLTANGGGDLLHLGAAPIVVGIEDPRRPYDNVRPFRRVSLDNMALATSGGSRRAWIIDGERYSHVVDPRSGRPNRGILSASVIANNAAEADVLATILTIVSLDEGLALCEEVGAGCLIITRGDVHCNPCWAAAEEFAAGIGQLETHRRRHQQTERTEDVRGLPVAR